MIRISDEVRESHAVVALETTLVAHGFPPGEGVEVGLESERQVRAAGAVPATIGVLDGEIVVGLTESELERFGADARKVGPRDLAAAVAQDAVGATTVGGTLAVARAAGISWMATGGLGGVHRGFPDPPDVSADLAQLARTPALVVSAGVKSLLDVPATSELLESLGVPVLGFRVDTLPLFYAAAGGPLVSARVESADEAARIARAHWELGGAGLLLGRPPDEPLDDVEPLIEQALRAAHDGGVAGQAVTPFVLSYLHRESGGRTQRANKDLIAQNSRLAGEIAAAASVLEVPPREREERECEHDDEIARRPDADAPAVHVRAAEGPELEQEPGEPRRLLGDHPQRVLVERLERERPRRDRRGVLHRVRVQRVADRAEEPGDEPRAEEHEDGDAVRGRGDDDGAEQARARSRSRRRPRARARARRSGPATSARSAR